MIDAHCHLDSERIAASTPTELAHARAAGVTDLVMAGTEPSSWAAQSKLARQHAGVWPVYGTHPWWAAQLDSPSLNDVLSALERACTSGSHAPPVAIGETGLDASRLAPPASLGPQEASFRAHLKLAIRLNLPVVLHILRAHDLALKVLADVGLPVPGGMVHSFSGSAELVRRYEALGLHVSFCGSVTRPQSRRLRAAAAAVSSERLLIETDAPDQAPHPHHQHGAPNRPCWLPLIADAVAQARGTSRAVIAELTSANASRLFSLPAAVA